MPTRLPQPLPATDLPGRLSDVFELVGPLYRTVARAVDADQHASGVPMGGRAVLKRLLAMGSATVPDVAAEMAVTRQYVQRAVDDADERGWVVRRPNPSHRRSALWSLSDAGRTVVHEVLDRERADLGMAADGLTHAQVDTCEHVLARLLEAVTVAEARPSAGEAARR